MAIPKLRIAVTKFERHEFVGTVAAASRAPEGHIADQTAYLAAYLAHEGSGAKTVVAEFPYVDRHFMEEYSRYYATVFNPLPSYTTRLHFFSAEFSLAQWHETLKRAGEDYEKAIATLQRSYLGFSVIRPIASAPIGRTILAPYRTVPSRIIRTVHRHRVHLCGLELHVDGVPFQQQEIAVGACATTALWTALASASRAIGQRGLTPYEVTEAATKHLLNDRAIPAQAGLELSQFLDAIRSAGFAPHALKPRPPYGAFSLAVKCYLASGFPVVLLVQDANLGYHAVTAIGYRESDDEHHANHIRATLDTHLLSTAGWSRIYIHEDRLGPYARFSWTDPPDEVTVAAGDSTAKVTLNDCPSLVRLPFTADDHNYDKEPLHVYAAIVPLYPKIRMSARNLMKVASLAYPAFRMLVGPDNAENLRVDLRFVLSGAYLRGLYESKQEQFERVSHLAASVPLPRYVGVVRYSYLDTPLAEVICDTTDIVRDVPRYGAMLGMFGLSIKYLRTLKAYAGSLGLTCW